MIEHALDEAGQCFDVRDEQLRPSGHERMTIKIEQGICRRQVRRDDYCKSQLGAELEPTESTLDESSKVVLQDCVVRDSGM